MHESQRLAKALLFAAVTLLLPVSSEDANGEPVVIFVDDWIRSRQLAFLEAFYRATHMNFNRTRGLHNWFQNGFSSTDDSYCSFSGVGCHDSYIVSLELEAMELTGTLPDRFDELPRLRLLRLFNNSIGGPIPESLARVSTLYHLNIGHNMFTGRLPSFVGAPLLRRLILDRNALTGEIPESYCKLTDLVNLDLSTNTKLRGSIPDCLGALTQLGDLGLTNMGLTGSVPDALCVEREMNGLTPNTFGCDGIVCSAGTYQRWGGRQRSEGSSCKECDVPSNVIGGSTCQWVDAINVGIDDSEAPSSEPSVAPSVRPSNIPTRTPSFSPSVVETGSPTPARESHEPSTPSEQPSSVPSSIPTDGDSVVPSVVFLAPTSFPSQLRSVSPTQAGTKAIVGVAQGEHVANDKNRGVLVAGASLGSLALICLMLLFWRRRRKRTRHQALVDKTEGRTSGTPTTVASSPALFPITEEPVSLSISSSGGDDVPTKSPSQISPRPILRDGMHRTRSGNKVRFATEHPRSGETFEEHEAWVSWMLQPVWSSCQTPTQLPDVESTPSAESTHSTTPILLTTSDRRVVSAERPPPSLLDNGTCCFYDDVVEI